MLHLRMKKHKKHTIKENYRMNTETSGTSKYPSRLVTLERREDGVAILTINHPPLNLFSLEMTRTLDPRLREISKNPSIRSMVLTGAGDRAFGAGSDIKEFPGYITTGTVIDKKLRYENEVYNRLEDLPQPTIAAMKGLAFGGGFELAMCCDFRVGAENLRIGLPEIKLGVYPGSGGLIRLPRLVGESRAKELMFLGNPISAEQAMNWGLLNRMVPEEDVMRSAVEFASELANRPAKAIQNMKKGIRTIETKKRDDAVEISLGLSDEVFRTEDSQEGVEAFFEKREPKFKHR
jgi:enoyl-CoA hydratase/carnithine racemase